MTALTHNLYDDAPKFVVAALKAAGRPLNADELADGYKPPRPNNFIELRAAFADENDFKRSEVTDEMVYAWLMPQAVDTVNAQNDLGDEYAIIEVQEDGPNSSFTGEYAFAEGVDPDTLILFGEPAIPQELPNPFDPETGAWKDNIREYDPEKSKALRESMETLGWLPNLPAIKDEHGVVIVGGRRLAIAKELDIEPVVKTVTFGDGPKGIAARAQLAIASNVGAVGFTAEERKRIAHELRASKFSMAAIAETLKVSAMTVSRDLRDFTGEKVEKRGRPRKTAEQKAADAKAKPFTMPKPTPPTPVMPATDAKLAFTITPSLPAETEAPDETSTATWAFMLTSDGTVFMTVDEQPSVLQALDKDTAVDLKQWLHEVLDTMEELYPTDAKVEED